MKKLFLLITLVMSAVLGMKADVTGVQVVTWQGGLFDNRTGVNGESANNGAHWRINLEQKEDGWVYEFPTPVPVKANELFCIRIVIDNGNSDEWRHSNLSYPQSNDVAFAEAGDGKDMKFSKDCNVNAVRFYWTGNDSAPWSMHFYVDDDKYTGGTVTPPDPVIDLSGKSNFALDTWNKPEVSSDGYQPWDVAGGLFDPFVTDAATKVTSEKNRNYPLASRFNKDNRFLMFCGPLTADEREKYGDHAKNWAVINGQETETELYVIDFCEGNDKRGLYIEVPTVGDMNRDDLKVSEGDFNADFKNNGTPLFYRMGVRFGFIDFESDFESDKPDGYKNHLRFVKWGHCFRLNEMSRPLNAFPVLNADKTKVDYFTDDYGPCEWNGLSAGEEYRLENHDVGTNLWEKWDYYNAEGWSESNGGGVKAVHNKKGDSRILAERNFWLKRIFLEVAYADPAKKFKRFYIYFDGEYDLNGGSRSFAQDFYVPATSGNYVGTTPNIFHGSNLAANEAGFHRFHNLNTDDAWELIGIDADDYTARTGRGRYLYDLEFTDSYSVKSTYKALNADGDVMTYTNSTKEIANDLEYTGENGGFKLADGTVLDKTVGADKLATVDVFGATLIFNPNDKAEQPATVTVENTYTFPNQAFPTVINDTYDFDGAHIDNNVTLPLEVTAVSRAADFSDFTCNVSWDAFASMGQGVAAAADGIAPQAADVFPVANYVLEVAPSASEETPDDDKFTIVTINNNGSSVMLGHDNTFWWQDGDNDKSVKDHTVFVPEAAEAVKSMEKKKYYVHYRLTACYNICWPNNGIIDQSYLFDNANDNAPTELMSTAPLADDGKMTTERVINDVVLQSKPSEKVTFTISPKTIVGHGYTEFNDNTQTGIEAVEAAGNDAPAEYYNLQGVRVAQPEAGQVYIVRRGAAVTKELAR